MFCQADFCKATEIETDFRSYASTTNIENSVKDTDLLSSRWDIPYK